MKKAHHFIGLVSAVLLSLSCEAIESSNEPVVFPPIEPQVAYSKVIQLPFHEADETLSYGALPLQFGKLWYSIPPDSGQPLIVLVHGGCWLNAFDMTHNYPLATALAQAGYPVWALEYRRTGDTGGGWPGSYEDIKAGIRYIPELKSFGIDTRNIILMGHSAGGHLALLAANEFAQLSNNTSQLTAAIGLAAITDVKAYSEGKNSCESAAAKFMGGTFVEEESLYQQAALSNKTLPANTLLFQGEADKIVAPSQATLANATTLKNKAAGHFDWIHPGSEAFKLLLMELNRISESTD